MANAAYYDFFRKIQLEPDGTTIEADSTVDTVTITRGTGVAFNPNATNDSFEIDVDYTLYVPLGTTDIRLTDVNANDQSITLTAGNNIGISRISDTEVSITATVGGSSKAIANATQANPVVITTSAAHSFTEGRPVTITDVGGMTELNGNEYYMDILTSTTFALYQDDALTTPVNGTGFTAYTTGGVATAEYFPRTQLSELSDVDTAGVTTNQILAYDGTEFVPTSILIGDVQGSVFADNSTVLVDGVGGKIVGDVETSRLRTSENNIALGNSAGATNQGSTSIAIGSFSGQTNQATNTIAIGSYAGQTGQSASSIAIGGFAGQTNQSVTAIALGQYAGQTNQDLITIAIGAFAGNTNQGARSIAIGSYAGQDDQGADSIAIGTFAGQTSQASNSIILNGQSSTALDTTTEGFFVAPVRNLDSGTFLTYDASTKEITYTDSINVIGSVFGDDSTLLIDGVNSIIPAENLSGTATINVTGNVTGNLTGDVTAGRVDTDIVIASVGIAGDLNGSVFADDSTLLVDGVNGIIPAENLTGTANINVTGNVTGNAAGDHTGTFTGDLIIDGYSTELVQSSLAGTSISLSLSLGSVGYVASPSGDITLNVTNVPTTDDRTISVSVILDQGATPYEITTLQIGGVGQTINWPDGIAPSGTVNGYDVFTFNLIRTGASWIVLGNMAGYT